MCFAEWGDVCMSLHVVSVSCLHVCGLLIDVCLEICSVSLSISG